MRPPSISASGRRWRLQRRPSRMRRGYVADKRWLKAGLGHRFEAGSELDQRTLAERRAEKTDAHGHPEHIGRGHVDNRVSRSAGQSGASEDEVVGKDQIGGPPRTVGWRYHR